MKIGSLAVPLMLALLALPGASNAQSWSGQSSGTASIGNPYSLCFTDGFNLAQDACLTQGGNKIVKLIGSLTLTGTLSPSAFVSSSANPAQSGAFRAASSDTFCWRNAANTADLCLNKNGSDQLFFSTHQFGLLDTVQTWTAGQTFSAQLASTVSTGTAPFSIASTTVTPNLNAQLLNGLTAPASAIVGISDTQTLTNKNLTSATSGNTVTLLCSSGPAGAITGNSGVQNIYSCTIPASVVANLKAIRVTAVWSHSTGTATVTYGMTLNGVALWPSNNTASTAGGISQSALIIETASTTGNVLTPQGFFSLTATSLTGLSWTSGQTLAATFNVANTDQVTPLFFLVELIQ